MVSDLRGALLKKQGSRPARLANFEFRLPARTMRLLEEAFRLDDRRVFDGKAHEEARAEARRRVIDELVGPAPHRLA